MPFLVSSPRANTLLALVLLVATQFAPGHIAAATPPSPMEGWLSIVWADPAPGGEVTVDHKIFLTDDQGASTELAMSDELLRGGVFRWNGKRVSVFPRDSAGHSDSTVAVAVAAIRLLQGADLAGCSINGGVTGSQPWISLLCKFSDIGAEPQNLDYFEGMYANVPGALDHYWREVSGNAIDIVGSTAIDWVTLPGTQVSYVPTPGTGTTADLNAIFNDCTAAVDALVDFSGGGQPFAGINLMLNANLDCCAWGGGRFATLDGVSKIWRTTWNPPWSFANEGVIAHEMGHGFGLPHANNFDGDSNPYDSPWDVMSSATGYSVDDPTYGALGKHVNAYHKDALGWFPAPRRFEAPDASSTTIQLDSTSLDPSSNFQIAVIPIDATRWYTVEARLRSGDYELALPGDAVIIHEIDTSRSQPSWSVDGDIPPADYADNPGTMWTVGETFVDAARLISVHVDAATATGFEVTITTGEFGSLFADDFESGNLLLWLVVN